jgi:dolichol-phosphate mannosyltransferase
MRKAVIILPTFNEQGNIGSLIEAIFEQTKKFNNWDLHVLVVDSKSKDKTIDEINSLLKKYPHQLHLLVTEKEGLGKAYIRGFNYAIDKLKAFVIFEMDADWSHNPQDIPRFLKKIEQGADFVIGSRYMKGGSIPQDWGIHRKLFSILGNLIVRFGFMRLKISEWTNGYRAIKSWVAKEILPDMNKYSGYVFQVAFIDKAYNMGANIQNIPINFIDRKKGISKINSVQYITQTILYVFTKSSFIKFVIVGSMGFIVDFAISFLLIEKVNWTIWLATLISAECAIISNFLFNNFWSFKHKKINNTIFSYFFAFFKFNLISSFSIIIQAIGIQLLASLFGHQLWIYYKIFIIAFIIIPYSYIFYNKFIWKKKN